MKNLTLLLGLEDKFILEYSGNSDEAEAAYYRESEVKGLLPMLGSPGWFKKIKEALKVS